MKCLGSDPATFPEPGYPLLTINLLCTFNLSDLRLLRITWASPGDRAVEGRRKYPSNHFVTESNRRSLP
jgi:hypothetical protein